MRVQNEGTGKSSWWMLNPDAKPGKAARRRATSMETSKFEKKRGRIKKKIEAMRNGGSILDTPSPSSSLSEGLDLFPESPHVRLSPILVLVKGVEFYDVINRSIISICLRRTSVEERIPMRAHVEDVFLQF